jgi:hypothetical protein
MAETTPFLRDLNPPPCFPVQVINRLSSVEALAKGVRIFDSPET